MKNIFFLHLKKKMLVKWGHFSIFVGEGGGGKKLILLYKKSTNFFEFSKDRLETLSVKKYRVQQKFSRMVH